MGLPIDGRPEHPLDELVDLVEGRLTPDREQGVRAHLVRCPACQEEHAWILAFREAAHARDLVHVPAATLVAIGAGGERTAAIDRHLSACARCREELALLEAFPSEAELDRALVESPAARETMPRETTRRPVLRFPSWRTARWLAVGAAAACVAVVLHVARGPIRVADLAVLEPLPVTTLRAAAEDSALARGAELYREADYQRAVESLRAATSRQPGDAEVRLLLGSAELLAGFPREAAVTLREASRLAGAGELRAVCLWVLVNAYLRAGDREAALAALADLQRAPGSMAERAQALSEKLARARG